MENDIFNEFLEESPFYTKINTDPKELEIVLNILNVDINLYYEICKNIRTFEFKLN